MILSPLAGLLTEWRDPSSFPAMHHINGRQWESNPQQGGSKRFVLPPHPVSSRLVPFSSPLEGHTGAHAAQQGQSAWRQAA